MDYVKNGQVVSYPTPVTGTLKLYSSSRYGDAAWGEAYRDLLSLGMKPGGDSNGVSAWVHCLAGLTGNSEEDKRTLQKISVATTGKLGPIQFADIVTLVARDDSENAENPVDVVFTCEFRTAGRYGRPTCDVVNVRALGPFTLCVSR